MALDKHALSELLEALQAGGDMDLLRSGLQRVLQALIDLEAAQVIGAEPYQGSPERVTHRNGARERVLSTKAGDLQLRIPKLHRQLLPLAAGAAPQDRPGAVGGGDGGVCPWRVHQEGR